MFVAAVCILFLVNVAWTENTSGYNLRSSPPSLLEIKERFDPRLIRIGHRAKKLRLITDKTVTMVTRVQTLFLLVIQQRRNLANANLYFLTLSFVANVHVNLF